MTSVEIEELVKKLRQRMKRIGNEKINHIFRRYSAERFEAARVIEEQAERIAELERTLADSRNNALQEAIPVATSLKAAISILENGGKKAVASDRMFEQMLTDYRKSLEDFRAILASIEGRSDD